MSNQKFSIKDLVVKIDVYKMIVDLNYPENRNFESGVGSGFFITDSLILTCYHVVENSTQIQIFKSGNEQPYQAIVKSIYPDDDLAVIQCITEDGKSELFKKKDFRIPYKIISQDDIKKIEGDKELEGNEDVTMKIQIYGFPLGEPGLKSATGTISGYFNSVFQVTAPVNPGNSGGPLVYNGKIIGINARKIVSSNIDNVAYAIPFKRFLIYASGPKKPINLKPKLNINFQFITDIEQYNKFKISEKNILDSEGNFFGTRITKIFKESNFYIAGLRKNDYLLKWDGKEIDKFGKIYFDGNKISINNINLWYYVGKEIELEYFSELEEKLKKISLILNSRGILPEFYYLSTLTNRNIDFYPSFKYFYKISNLVISVVTIQHTQELDKLHSISMESKIFILNNLYQMRGKFLVYLTEADSIHFKKNLPQGNLIYKINDNIIENVDILKDLEDNGQINSIEFFDGSKFFI
tara:strand:- start:5210 stop:6610 length:1401 start_codon:yes stop_codon:yes gene_type:complete